MNDGEMRLEAFGSKAWVKGRMLPGEEGHPVELARGVSLSATGEVMVQMGTAVFVGTLHCAVGHGSV